MRRFWIVLAFVAGAVAACSGSTASVQPGTGVPSAAAALPQATVAVASPAGAASSPASSPAASTGDATSGAPTNPTACSLITADEAAAALGAAVNPATPSVDPKENACTFGGHALADMINFVEIDVINPVEFTPTRASVAGVFDITAADGIGEAAYYQKDYLPNNSGTRMALAVKKGQTVFRIEIVNSHASDSQLMASEKTLAMAALGRV